MIGGHKNSRTDLHLLHTKFYFWKLGNFRVKSWWRKIDFQLKPPPGHGDFNALSFIEIGTLIKKL